MPQLDDQTSRLITDALPLVGYGVRELMARVPPHVNRDDLFSAGSYALVQAARAYDPTTGVPFPRYASLRIRGALVDELRSMDWASRGTRKKAKQITDVTEKLAAQLGRTPTREEVANAAGVALAEVDAGRQAADRRVLSLEGFDGEISDTIRDEGPTPEDHTLQAERLVYLHAAVSALPEHLRTLIEEIFFEARPVIKIAEERGVTQSRISQMRSEALNLMKDAMNSSLDPDLVPAAALPNGAAERRRQAYFGQVSDLAASARAKQTVQFAPTSHLRGTPGRTALLA